MIGVILITLKFAGVIAWSWVWILAPFWGPALCWFAVYAGLSGIILAGQRKPKPRLPTIEINDIKTRKDCKTK